MSSDTALSVQLTGKLPFLCLPCMFPGQNWPRQGLLNIWKVEKRQQPQPSGTPFTRRHRDGQKQRYIAWATMSAESLAPHLTLLPDSWQWLLTPTVAQIHPWILGCGPTEAATYSQEQVSLVKSEKVQLLSRVSLFGAPWTPGPARLLCPWDSPGKNTGVGCHFLLQGVFLRQGLNLVLLHYRQILYSLTQIFHRQQFFIELYTNSPFLFLLGDKTHVAS